MRNGFLPILILFCTFFFSDEVQARALSGEAKMKLCVEKASEELLTATTDTHTAALEQNQIRIVPASRCGQVQKCFGSGNGFVLSLSANVFPYLLPRSGRFIASKSSYLSHIYPSHNFW